MIIHSNLSEIKKQYSTNQFTRILDSLGEFSITSDGVFDVERLLVSVPDPVRL